MPISRLTPKQLNPFHAEHADDLVASFMSVLPEEAKKEVWYGNFTPDGELATVASISVAPQIGVGYISNLYTAPELRLNGYAKELCKWLVERLKDLQLHIQVYALPTSKHLF